MRYLIFLVFAISLNASPLQMQGNQYKGLLQDLINEKRMTVDDIKRSLNSNQKTVSKMLLTAVDFDYNKKDIKSASLIYIELINKAGKNLKNTTEALYLADFLYRMKQHKDIPVLLDRYGCETYLDDEKKRRCYLYLSIVPEDKSQY